MTPVATVVIPYFEDQRVLDLVLTGLELQTLPPAAFEVVVADDGSRTAPETGGRPYPVRVVRQADLGIRPAAARNLGARAGTGATLVFLDGDTVPGPRYVEEMVAACDGRRLVAGRRRYADLSGVDPPALRSWLTTGAPEPPLLDAPEWLERAYAETDGLARTDLRSYRFVISAVLACPRALLERVGGFAEEINGYGGEDWEFARRCWLAGADFAYAPDAVAWHDGPDLGGRPGSLAEVKNGETLRIAGLLTDPALRGRGFVWPYPRFVVRLGLPRDVPDGARLACAEGLLATGDVGVWLGTDAASAVPDPRLHRGMPGAAVLGRCELVVDVRAPVRTDASTLEDWQRAAPASNASVTVRSPRDIALDTPLAALPESEGLPGDLQLERWFGRPGAGGA
jgi:GT2 family glycosyltransferase